jgi:hypothetical protein
MPRLVTAVLGLVCLGVTSPALSQSRIVPQVPVASCGYADSLLSTDWERASVTASRGPDGRVHLTSAVPGVIRTTIEMNVSVEYRDSVPPRDPYGTLKMTVFNDRGLAQALIRPDTTALVLVLDDTLSFNLGNPIESEVRGATRGSHLSINANLPRNPFLALARAKKGRAEVAGRSYPIGRQLLRAMSRTYRAAICIHPDSLPELRL